MGVMLPHRPISRRPRTPLIHKGSTMRRPPPPPPPPMYSITGPAEAFGISAGGAPPPPQRPTSPPNRTIWEGVFGLSAKVDPFPRTDSMEKARAKKSQADIMKRTRPTVGTLFPVIAIPLLTIIGLLLVHTYLVH